MTRVIPIESLRIGRAASNPIGFDGSAQSPLNCGDPTMLNDPRLTDLRTEILRIGERHGASNMRVFGSLARGEAKADSDIDFLVDMEPGRSLFDLGGLQYDLELLLGQPVDVVTVQALRPRVKNWVLGEAVSL